MIRLKRQRVAVATPDNRKTEGALAERGGVERENGRGQRVHRTASCLNQRCCCGPPLLIVVSTAAPDGPYSAPVLVCTSISWMVSSGSRTAGAAKAPPCPMASAFRNGSRLFVPLTI